MKNKPDNKSKRQVLREQREQKQRRERMIIILAITTVTLVIAGLLIAPSVRNAVAPVGDIVDITPKEYPQPEGTALGDPNAPVKIEVYEDFQCPACKSYTESIEPQVIDNLVKTGQVYYVFRQFPFLDDRAPTKESDQSANASMCAADQGKFWDYHAMIYANWNGENAGNLSDKRLVAFAEKLGLDMNQFNSCFRDNNFENRINEDLAAGQAAGVSGTPSVLVNGQIIRPGFVPSYEDIAAAVNSALTSQ